MILGVTFFREFYIHFDLANSRVGITPKIFSYDIEEEIEIELPQTFLQ